MSQYVLYYILRYQNLDLDSVFKKTRKQFCRYSVTLSHVNTLSILKRSFWFLVVNELLGCVLHFGAPDIRISISFLTKDRKKWALRRTLKVMENLRQQEWKRIVFNYLKVTKGLSTRTRGLFFGYICACTYCNSCTQSKVSIQALSVKPSDSNCSLLHNNTCVERCLFWSVTLRGTPPPYRVYRAFACSRCYSLLLISKSTQWISFSPCQVLAKAISCFCLSLSMCLSICPYVRLSANFVLLIYAYKYVYWRFGFGVLLYWYVYRVLRCGVPEFWISVCVLRKFGKTSCPIVTHWKF